MYSFSQGEFENFLRHIAAFHSDHQLGADVLLKLLALDQLLRTNEQDEGTLGRTEHTVDLVDTDVAVLGGLLGGESQLEVNGNSFDLNSNEDKSKYKRVCIGDIAYNSMRMWQGASGYSPYEGIVSPAYTVLSPNSGINSKCLAYQFKLPEMIHTFQVNSQGITSDNWNLKYPALSQIEIFVSKDEQEQAKIAEYFENLDNLITLHQREHCLSIKA